MRYSMSIGPGEAAPGSPSAPSAPGAAREEELCPLEAQLERMRAMRFGGLVGLVVPAAVAWTAVIAAYLAWASLRRADEDLLLATLDAAYRLPAPGASPGPRTQEDR